MCERRRLLADVREPLEDVLIAEGLADRGGWPCRHLGRRTARGPDGMPVDEVEASQAGLVHRRNLRRGSKADAGRHCEWLDALRANLRYGIRRQIEQNVDVSRHKVLHRRGKTAIGYEPEPCAGECLEFHRADV